MKDSKNDNKNREIFYAIVAIATLIVALIGATLAYFSISAGSESGAVSAKAAVVSIEYNDGQQVSAKADKLIPASLAVVKAVYQSNQENFVTEGDPDSNLCTDDNDQQVCSIYRFTVKSDVERAFNATLNTDYNDFTYLAYAVRDVNNNTWIKLDGTNESLPIARCADDLGAQNCYTTEDGNRIYKIGGGSSDEPRTINSIFGYTSGNIAGRNISNTEQKYDIVIFLKENNANQNIDQGREYQGTIKIETTEVGDSGIITGRVNGVS